MKPEDIKLQDARKLIDEGLPAYLKASQAFYEGDHWQGGNGWIGPAPTLDDPLYGPITLDIERGFVSQNATAEIVDRHRDGVIGREPAWGLTVSRPLGKVDQKQADGTVKSVDEQPDEAEQALIDEAEAALTEWWDKRGAHALLKQAAASALWAGRGALRLFVPKGQLDEQGKVETAPLLDSMLKIWANAPDPDSAVIHRDMDTWREAALYFSKDSDGKERLEVQFIDRGKTVVRSIGAEGKPEEASQYDLGGRLLMHQIERRPIVTLQTHQNQRLLNEALTMLARNVETAGFRERIYFNVARPQKRVVDSNADGGYRLEDVNPEVGAGSVNFFMGVKYKDEEGKVRLATPGFHSLDPVEVKTFQETKGTAYQAMVQGASQAHVLISGDATASGESRKQARDEFNGSLTETKPQVNQMGRWLVETVLALAAMFAGRTGEFAGLRGFFECRVNPGPRSADDDRGVIERVNADLLSRESAMSETGVEDTEAEMAKIAEERESDIEAGRQRAEIEAELADNAGADTGDEGAPAKDKAA